MTGYSQSISSKGYVRIYLGRNHRLADRSGMAYLHRVRLRLLGVRLRPGKTGHHVHHRNGVKTDNRPSNLVRLTARAHNSMPRKAHLTRRARRRIIGATRGGIR